MVCKEVSRLNNKESRLYLPPPQIKNTKANKKYEIVNPPSILKSAPKLAVKVAISIVKAISEAAALEYNPIRISVPPKSSLPFAKKAITRGIGK